MRIASNTLKTPVLAAILLAWIPPSGWSQGKVSSNIDVTIAASLSRDSLAPGAGADLLFTLTPKKGFHVNAVPPMAVSFDSGTAAKQGGKIVIPSDTSTGYLKPSLPVRQPFTLAVAAKKGRSELKGVFTYYYCSDAQGWCRKETLRFAVPIVVR